jgi:PIN domain nuclease of toxin-antitoxin system
LPEAKIIVENTESLMQRSGFIELPITHAHARAAGMLLGPHRDPFDRLLIAQAKLESASIVSADPVFASYGVPTIW